jgi:hypothetical protein
MHEPAAGTAALWGFEGFGIRVKLAGDFAVPLVGGLSARACDRPIEVARSDC